MRPTTLRNLAIALAVLCLVCMPSVASADNVTWTVTSLASSDGGSFSGSFVYNADTNTYSSIDVVSTMGTALNGATYTNLDPNPLGVITSNDEFLILVADTSLAAGTPILGMEFESPFLTDAGGTLLVLGIEGLCNAGCTDTEGENFREFEAVAISPEPSSLLLLGSGLLGLLGIAKRKIMHA